MSRESLPKLAARHFIFWGTDMACGLAGWVYGFGLQVQNWWAVLGFLFLSRWLVFVIHGAHDMATRRKESESDQKSEGAAP